MKIAFVSGGNLIICGGIIVPFEYVSRLKQQGYEADIYSDERNPVLENFYHCQSRPSSDLSSFTDDDVIILIRWESAEWAKQFKGKKYQFVQGNDLVLIGESEREKCKVSRNDPVYSLLGVSQYSLDTWNRGKVVPNGVNERFFRLDGRFRDIEVLIEGNDDTNKNIAEAIAFAKGMVIGGQKIAWMARSTTPNSNLDISGIEKIENPAQEEIPGIYQRAKKFIKLSKTEGFCLPILEAMASGCVVYTRPMGGNDFCVYEGSGHNCYDVDRPFNPAPNMIKNARQTAESFSWDRSVKCLLDAL